MDRDEIIRVLRAFEAAGLDDIRVQKFRSIEEMNRAAVSRPRQSDFERFLRHCARYWALAPSLPSDSHASRCS